MKLKETGLFFSGFITTLYASFFIIAYTNMCPVAMGGADSAAFSTIGMAWANGLIPYRDVFDHKGPFLWLINAIGYFINGEFYGVVYIQVVCIVLTNVLLLMCNSNNPITYSFFVFFIFNYSMVKIFEGGNLSEEYSFLFNAIATYAFIKKCRYRFFSYGLVGTILFLIRPNLAAPSLALVIIDFCDSGSKHFL